MKRQPEAWILTKKGMAMRKKALKRLDGTDGVSRFC